MECVPRSASTMDTSGVKAKSTATTFQCGDKTLLIHEAEEGNGTYAHVWASGAFFAAWVGSSDITNTLYNKHVVELGSGTGISGIAIASAGAASVHLTDIIPAVSLLQTNILLNCDNVLNPITCGSLKMSKLDSCGFSDIDKNTKRICKSANIILATDVLFNESMTHLVCFTISKILQQQEIERKKNPNPKNMQSDNPNPNPNATTEAWVVFCDRTIHGDDLPLTGFARAGLEVIDTICISESIQCKKLLEKDEYEYMFDVKVLLYKLTIKS